MRSAGVAAVVVIVGMAGSVLLGGDAGAQVPLGGTSTETHINSDSSSNEAILAAIRAPVAGEPYVAQKVTRSVWTLGDGTKITHESNTKIARDADGRVREAVENRSASSFGGTQVNRTSESITIADPVAHTVTIYTPGPAKVAIRMQLPELAGLGKLKLPGGGAFHGISGVLETSPPPPPQGFAGPRAHLGSTNPAVAAEIAKIRAEKDEVQTEELGNDAIDGVTVEGKRTTTTIPTGQIGNDRPIVITHEEWYSPDLKLVVKSVDEDPRTGERTMELEGLTIGDPDPALFQVPAGYQVRDMPDMLKTLARPSKPEEQ
jgi:hypothetical protein